MSLFDQVGSVLGSQLKGMGGGQLGLVTGVLEMLSTGGQGGPGGLAGLLQAFQSKGLSDIASSWISAGPNLPVSAAQIQEALGGERIGELAAKAGLAPDALSAKLAEVLPGAVDKLTPDGNIPEAGMFEQVLGVLKSKLG